MHSLQFIGDSLWFFLPALVGNQFPGFAVWVLARIGHPEWNVPVSERWLGSHKTWLAYPAAMWGATLTTLMQGREYAWVLGALFGIGIIAGDHAKSFFKRRVGIPPGAPWWPLDQLDFVVGGLLAASFLVGWSAWTTAIVIVPTVLLFHRLLNGLGYLLGLRKVPY